MDKLDDAKKAVSRMFADTTVSQTATFDRLVQVVEHCKELMDALPEAEQNQ